MTDVTMKELLEAGVHFGHQTQKWDPRMKPYIFGARRGIHIINLEQTVPMLKKACDFIEDLVAAGGDVLFVGTKRQAQSLIEEQAKQCGMHYVNHRWLGGTLTNFQTIKASIDRLIELETKMEEGGFEGLTKKERRMIERDIKKLRKSLDGIKKMGSLPACLFIIDPKKESIAQQEANRLGIPVVALTDTNCNPEGIDYIIPGNDDAIKAIRIFSERIATSCQQGLEKRQERIRAEVEKAASKDESAKEEAKVQEVAVKQERAFVSREVRAESDTVAPVIERKVEPKEESSGGDG